MLQCLRRSLLQWSLTFLHLLQRDGRGLLQRPQMLLYLGRDALPLLQ